MKQAIDFERDSRGAARAAGGRPGPWPRAIGPFWRLRRFWHPSAVVGSAGKSLVELAAGLLRGAGVEFRSLSVLALDRSSPHQVFGIVLCFPDGCAEPTHVIKLTTDARRAHGLANEFAHLSHLGAGGDDSLTAALPRAVHLGEVDEWHVLVETALPGRRMKDYPPDAYFASRRFERHLVRVRSWLSAFERCCTAGRGVEPAGA